MNADKKSKIPDLRLSAFICVLICISASAQQPPYKPAAPPDFSAPGRDDPEPAGLTEVRFGWFGPPEGPMWTAANRAVDELNRAGGYKGLPFRLIPGWASDPWRAGALHLTRMVFRDGVWALIAAANGDAVHLAEQVAAKASLTVMNPAATDRTLHAAGVPWIFSCVQGDDAIARALAEAAANRAVTLVSSTDHDSRALVAYLKPLIRIAHQVEFEPGRAARAAEAMGDTVIVIAGARDTAEAVKLVRAKTVLAGRPAAGARYPVLADAPACAYDSVKMLAAAIREAGLNRSRIRDAMRSLSPYEGASGRIEWDAFGQNRRPVRLGP